MSLAQPPSNHAVPPHDHSGNEHHCRREAKGCPDGLDCLIADARTAARQSDAIDPPEVRIRKPGERVVQDARPRTRRSGRIQPVNERMKRFREAQVDPADGENDGEANGPETDRAMKIPR